VEGYRTRRSRDQYLMVSIKSSAAAHLENRLVHRFDQVPFRTNTINVGLYYPLTLSLRAGPEQVQK